MAQKRQRHGKVEARQQRTRLRFKPGVIVIIVLFCFGGCFAWYMVSALSQEDYWEKEIVASLNENNGKSDSSGKRADVTNPVPSSERADESRMGTAAFMGDVATFAGYYETNQNMVFTDAITGLAESRMRSIGRSLADAKPVALYIWYQCPEDTEKAAASLQTLTEHLTEQAPAVPIYLLTATPTADPEQNKRIDTWNAALFSLADEKGLHYVDISTTLKSNDGTLAPGYDDPKTFYTTVGDLILTHVAD